MVSAVPKTINVYVSVDSTDLAAANELAKELVANLERAQALAQALTLPAPAAALAADDQGPPAVPASSVASGGAGAGGEAPSPVLRYPTSEGAVFDHDALEAHT